MTAPPESTDPASSFEHKLADFEASLTEEEATILHDLVHLAFEGGEVHGFAMPQFPAGFAGDPCEGGEVQSPLTVQVLGNLHLNLHRRSAQTPRP